MRKLAVSLFALGIAAVSLSTTCPASASADDGAQELACKPRGSTCHNSDDCCSQNCQTVNGKEICH